jgi:competence protein ComEC
MNNMSARVLYVSLVAGALGIGAQTLFPALLEVIVWGLFLGFVLALLWRKKSFAFFAPQLLLASVFMIALTGGMLRAEIASWQFGQSSLETMVGTDVILSGSIANEPEERERTIQFYLQTETDKLLISADRLTSVAYGDEVVVRGRLKEPEAFTTDLGRTFNYPGYLQAKGMEYQISFAEVTTAGSGAGNFFITRVLNSKTHFIAALENSLPEPAVSLAKGLLLGVKSALGEDVEEDFRRAGIIHIVVLSGYNIMLVVAFILFCFSYVLPLRWRLLCGVVAITVFALLVGLSATVVRASIMASLVLLAQFLGRRYNVLRALFFAGATMLFINPYLLIYDIGFQLSFMATLGLVLILPLFENKIVEGKGIGVREFFLSTLATQIAVLPLLMYHIGQVSLIALLVNVLVLPVVPLAMLLTFFTGLLGLVSVQVASVVGYIATLSLQYVLLVAEWFADVPFAAVTVPVFSGWGVLGLYACMIGSWLWWKQRGYKSEVSDWTIDEEEKQNNAQKTGTKKVDVPIFFR